MALSVYRRHRAGCKHAHEPINKKGCRCGFWVRGTLEGKTVRESLKTKNWERAEELRKELEGAKQKVVRLTVADAITRYQADCVARDLTIGTRLKIQKLLERLQAFTNGRAITHLNQVSLSELDEFRQTWTTWNALVQEKQIERLRAFFRFCLRRKWIEDSPAQELKPPKKRPATIVPFTEQELDKIHAAIGRPIMRAFVLTLQHTGLRISDAVQLRKQDIENGKLCIRTEKTKSTVWLPLPPSLLAALEQIKCTEYYFWTGESKLSTVIGSKRRGLAKLLTRAGVRGNPHKFRHTLATTLLANGTSTAIVAKILGNSPKVVEKHYDHWIAARQAQLETELQKTWQTRLTRVK
jgi:integrase